MIDQAPFIVKIVEPPRDPLGLADVLMQAIGLTGVVALLAILLGLLLAGVLFWARSRHPLH